MSVVRIETYVANILSKIVTSKFEYDTNGTKVQKIVETDSDADGNIDSSTTTTYLNDNNNFTGYSQVIEEIKRDTATQAVQKAFVYLFGSDAISQTEIDFNQILEDVVLVLLKDGHGSTRFVTNVNAAIEEGYNYDAYGNALGFDTAAAMTSLLYAGEQFDSTINQLYLRQRWYNPSAGTFNRLDPFAGNFTDQQSLHKYLYTHGDPVNGTDPTGLFTLAGRLATASIIGGLTSILGNGLANYANGDPFFQNAANAYVMGAILAPVALFSPGVALALSMYGVATAVPFAVDVIGNKDSTTGQKMVALSLAGLSFLGVKGAARNVRVNGFWQNSSLMKSVQVKTKGSSSNPPNAQPQPTLRKIPRTANDKNVNPDPPEPLSTSRPISKNAEQNKAVQRYIEALRKSEAKDIRVNQQQVNANRQRVGVNRPDLQFTDSKGKRWYIEWDTKSSNRGIPHGERILANDPKANTLLFTLD